MVCRCGRQMTVVNSDVRTVKEAVIDNGENIVKPATTQAYQELRCKSCNWGTTVFQPIPKPRKKKQKKEENKENS